MTCHIENLAALASRTGQLIATSPWREISQADIDAFAQGTGDDQWIHVNPERAERESPFGTTIAHGFLTISLLPRLMFDAIDIGGIALAINYGLNRVRLPAPVPSGSRVRAHFTLVSLEPVGNATQALWHCEMEREGSDKPVCVAEWLMRYMV